MVCQLIMIFQHKFPAPLSIQIALGALINWTQVTAGALRLNNSQSPVLASTVITANPLSSLAKVSPCAPWEVVAAQVASPILHGFAHAVFSQNRWPALASRSVICLRSGFSLKRFLIILLTPPPAAAALSEQYPVSVRHCTQPLPRECFSSLPLHVERPP